MVTAIRVRMQTERMRLRIDAEIVASTERIIKGKSRVSDIH